MAGLLRAKVGLHSVWRHGGRVAISEGAFRLPCWAGCQAPSRWWRSWELFGLQHQPHWPLTLEEGSRTIAVCDRRAGGVGVLVLLSCSRGVAITTVAEI